MQSFECVIFVHEITLHSLIFWCCNAVS